MKELRPIQNRKIYSCRGGSRIFLKGGGSILKRGSIGLQVKKGGYHPGGGPTFDPMLKSLQRGGKRGGSRPPGPPGSAHELEGGKDNILCMWYVAYYVVKLQALCIPLLASVGRQ